MGRNGGLGLGWAHGRCPGKRPDFGGLEGGPNALGEGRRRGRRLADSAMLKPPLRLPALLSDPSHPCSPASAGPEDTSGAPSARGRGFNSGPRFPFKGFRNFPPWYQMSLVTSVGRGRRGAFRGSSGHEFPRGRGAARGRRVWAGPARGAQRTRRRAATLAAPEGPGPCGAATARQRGQRRPTCSTWRCGRWRLGASLSSSPASSPGLLPSAAAAGPGRAQPFPAAPRRAESDRTRSRRAGQDGPGRARAPGPAAGMGALARALLWPLLAQWLLRAAPALAAAPFTLPLRVAAATGRGVAPTPGPGPPAVPGADGLAFALEPAGGAANFLAMVDNLQGDSGRGYYLEVLIGTPPQKVGRWALARPPGPAPRQPCSPPAVAAGPGGLVTPRQAVVGGGGRRGLLWARAGRARSGAVAAPPGRSPGVCARVSELVHPPLGLAGQRGETCNFHRRDIPSGGDAPFLPGDRAAGLGREAVIRGKRFV